MRNLTAEGPHAHCARRDVMVDVLIATQALIASAPGRYLPEHLRDGPYLLATVHRQETTDDPAG